MGIRRWLAVACMAWLGAPAHAGYTALYAFGDSLSDSGNLYNLVYAVSGGTVQVPPPPYFQGRASNGPVAVEYLAQALGLTAQPMILPDGSVNPLGSNFALLGSATGPVAQLNATWSNYMPFRYDPALPDWGMDFQVAAFASYTGGVADPGALYFLWGGANDAYLALEDPDLDLEDQPTVGFVAQGAAATAADNLMNLVLALAGMGARTFLVPNLPDLGLTPDALLGGYGTYYAWGLTSYTNHFNSGLSAKLAYLDALPGIDIIPFDVYGVFADLRASGLYDTTLPCLMNPLCDPSDTGNTVFWDGVHPTTAFHKQLGLMMARAVPEPAPFLLLAAGVTALFALRRTRSA